MLSHKEASLIKINHPNAVNRAKLNVDGEKSTKIEGT